MNEKPAPEPPPALLESLRARVRELEAALASARAETGADASAPAASESTATAVVSITADGLILDWDAEAERQTGLMAADVVGRHVSILPPSMRFAQVETLLDKIERSADSGMLLRVGYWDFDLASGRITCSEEAYRVFDLEPPEDPCDPTPYLNRMRPEDVERLQQLSVRAIQHGTPFSFDHAVTSPGGSLRWAHMMGRPVLDSAGRVRALAGAIQDVTDRRLGEEAQKEQSLAVLAGGVAHDFNNLLVGILGNADLALALAPPDPRLRETLEDIRIAGLRAADLVRQMLAYAGRGKYVVERVELPALVAEMSNLLGSAIGCKAELCVDAEECAPAIRADATQLRQVVMNLITNAAEAIGPEGGRIAVRTGPIVPPRDLLEGAIVGRDLEPGRCAFLEVSDTGSGIEPGVLARIFEPFFTTKYQGRGLGLAATLGIVRSHGGALNVRSTPGVGTTFTLVFPADDESDAAEGGGGAAAPAFLGRILVVDDEEVVRNLMIRFLTEEGYDVVLADDGPKGVEAFEQRAHEIDLVFLDLTLPGMRGECVFERMRAARPDVPVAVMSGFDESEAKARLDGLDITAFVHKPFSLSAITAVLDRLPKRGA